MCAWYDAPGEKARLRAEAVLRAHAWPAATLGALARLRAAGARAWITGGGVRDALLGRGGPAAGELLTDLRPGRVHEAFAGGAPEVAAPGVVTVKHEGERFEVTTFRPEAGPLESRDAGEECATAGPDEHLDRPGLTVDALAFDPADGRLHDPHEGALDLERRLLRAVGDPLERFGEDASRAVRVAHFAAALGFGIEPATRAALAGVRERAAHVDPGRLRVELERLVLAAKPSTGFEVLREAGLLAAWVPELQACRGVPQNRHHAYDVYFHSLYACDAAPAARPVVRWAALLHDVGKPATRAERRGEGTFHRHEVAGAGIARSLLERLRFPAAFTDRVVHLVREHMFDPRPGWSDAALRRWLRRVGRAHVAELFDLRIADSIGNGTRAANPLYLDELAARIDRLLDPVAQPTVADLAVDGHDVARALDVAPGPAVGRALARLLEEVTEDAALNTRDRLLARLANLREEAPGEWRAP